MGQGCEDLVKLLIALNLAALRTPAAPQQAQLELSAEDLQELGLALEACKGNKNPECQKSGATRAQAFGKQELSQLCGNGGVGSSGIPLLLQLDPREK